MSDLLQDLRRLSPIYRPRINDAEGVRSMVDNGLFERTIRQAAGDPAIERRPEVAAVLADRVEFHAVSNYLQKAVVEKIPTDSLTLLRYYKAHASAFDEPARNVLVTVMLGDSRAESLARVFRVTGNAESLAFRAQKSGVTYTLAVTEARDSLLFRQASAAGAGSVIGPDKVESGWRVIKVLSLDPRTTQPFEVVRKDVERSWYELESERRIRTKLDALKKAARIEYNDKALRGLVLSPAGTGR